ncbi:MAG: hypothetical protein WAR01_09265, partial [Dokdonella sp.]|uniref:hypothetical protein n=1 Tax=Dokdonella sp. TaxID=2291710 RepID=UPI003BB1826C
MRRNAQGAPGYRAGSDCGRLDCCVAVIGRSLRIGKCRPFLNKQVLVGQVHDDVGLANELAGSQA